MDRNAIRNWFLLSFALLFKCKYKCFGKGTCPVGFVDRTSERMLIHRDLLDINISKNEFEGG